MPAVSSVRTCNCLHQYTEQISEELLPRSTSPWGTNIHAFESPLSAAAPRHGTNHVREKNHEKKFSLSAAKRNLIQSQTERTMADFRIGTCSWKYGEWKGLVYSSDKGIDFLSEYAGKYDTVEIDQWFWSLHGPGKISMPDQRTVRSYADAVPADFLFTIKAPNSVTLTHFYAKSKQAPLEANEHFLSVDLFDRFLECIAPLLPRTASIMLQFEYLNKQKMPGRDHFLEALAPFLAHYAGSIPIGVETRNPNYLARPYFDLLNNAGAHHVFLQGYYMPDVREVIRAHSYGGKQTVIRLHGPDRKGMEEKSGGVWNRLVEARDDELRGMANVVATLLGDGIDVLVNVNNHYEGCAPLTIERFMALLNAVLQDTGVPPPSRRESRS
jgi:uncharacterized protein YecE (DUF72 family)